MELLGLPAELGEGLRRRLPLELLPELCRVGEQGGERLGDPELPQPPGGAHGHLVAVVVEQRHAALGSRLVIEVAKEERALLERPPLVSTEGADPLIDDRLPEGGLGAEIGECPGHKAPQGGIAIPEEGPEAADGIGIPGAGGEPGGEVPQAGVGDGEGVMSDRERRRGIEGIESLERQSGHRGLGIGGEAAEERGRGGARLALEQRHGEDPPERRRAGGGRSAGGSRRQTFGRVDQARLAHAPQRPRCREPDFRGKLTVGDEPAEWRRGARLAGGAEGVDGEQAPAGGEGGILDPGEPAVSAGEMIPSSQGRLDEPGDEEAVALGGRRQFRGDGGGVEGHKGRRRGAPQLRIGLLGEGHGQPRNGHLEPLHPPPASQPDRVDRQPARLGIGPVEGLLPERQELLRERRRLPWDRDEGIELLGLVDGQFDRGRRRCNGSHDKAGKADKADECNASGAPSGGRAERRRRRAVNGHGDRAVHSGRRSRHTWRA